ncbi:MAG: hypothetical protein NT175_02540 [Bacteroidetes bacterium]|nr:hypothetical protein [Bacteroidota bacterium]
MKTKKVLATLAFMFMLLAGCIPSLHPLYTDKDRISMDEIMGVWLSAEGTSMYYIIADPDDQPSYTFTYFELPKKNDLFQRDSTPANLEVNLVRLGGATFMDFYPGDNEYLDKMNTLLAIHLIPAHTFAKFRISNDTLTIWRFDPDWLKKLFEENRIRISHEKLEDQIVLTASTEELQKFVAKYADDPEAYIDPEVLIRKR